MNYIILIIGDNYEIIPINEIPTIDEIINKEVCQEQEDYDIEWRERIKTIWSQI